MGSSSEEPLLSPGTRSCRLFPNFRSQYQQLNTKIPNSDNLFKKYSNLAYIALKKVCYLGFFLELSEHDKQ